MRAGYEGSRVRRRGPVLIVCAAPDRMFSASLLAWPCSTRFCHRSAPARAWAWALTVHADRARLTGERPEDDRRPVVACRVVVTRRPFVRDQCMVASPVVRRSRACSPACRHCFICPLKCSRALAAFQSAGPVSLCSCGCRNAPLHCPHCGDCSVKGRSLALRMPCASISTVVGASMRPWPDSWCRSERACQRRPGNKVMRVASWVQWPLREPSSVSAVACGCSFICH